MDSEIYPSLAVFSVVKHGKSSLSVLCTPTACPALGTAVRWEWWDCQRNKMWCCSSSAVPPHLCPQQTPWQGFLWFTLLWFHSKIRLHMIILAQLWVCEGSPGAVTLLPVLPFPWSLPSVTGSPRHTEEAELQLCSPSVLPKCGCTQPCLGLHLSK